MDLVAPTAYIGFPIPSQTTDRILTLVSNLRSGVPEQQGALYSEVVLALVKESLTTFFVNPVKDIGVKPMTEKMVFTGVTTVQKAVGILVNLLSKKLSNADMLPATEYLVGLIVQRRRSDERAAYMVCPLDAELDARLVKVLAEIEAGDAGTDIESRLTAIVLAINERSLDLFFAKPLEMLKLGMVARKTGQVAFEATRVTTGKVIKKAFNGMENQELRGVMRQIEHMRFDADEFEPLQTGLKLSAEQLDMARKADDIARFGNS